MRLRLTQAHFLSMYAQKLALENKIFAYADTLRYVIFSKNGCLFCLKKDVYLQRLLCVYNRFFGPENARLFREEKDIDLRHLFAAQLSFFPLLKRPGGVPICACDVAAETVLFRLLGGLNDRKIG